MKKYLFITVTCIFLIIQSFQVTGQNITGKKASLNADASINLESIAIPEELASIRSDFEMLDGFPFGRQANASFKNFRGATLADIDQDGVKEILFGANSTLFVIEGNGDILWSRVLSGTIIFPPSVADMDMDDDLEIIVNTGGSPNAGRVYLLDEVGNDLPGWPMNFDQHWMFNAPAISDVDEDGTMEVVTCERGNSTSGFLHIIKLDGTPLNPNWPLELPGNLAFTPSIGDVDADGTKDIVISISSGSLYALDLDGVPLTGFPLTEAGKSFSYQSPILVDLDGDQTLEIVGSRHGDMPDYYVVKSDGTYMDGWPVTSPGWRYSPPTVVDADFDDVYDIYVGHPNTNSNGTPLDVIYGFNPQGDDLPNFPINKHGGCEGVISVADVNNDGVQDVVFTSNITDMEGYGFIHAYAIDGSGEIDGFPLRPRGFTFINSALLGDVNNDGLLDLTCLSYTQFTGNDSVFISTYNLEVPYIESDVLSNGYKGNNLRDGLANPLYTGIAEKDQENMKMRLSPNPSSGKLNIEFDQKLSEGILEIYNNSGVLFKTFEIENTRFLQLNLENLPSGQYLIRIQSEEVSVSRKWVKM
ncbi:MAG: T9SS type A sorting domain-containing protein [Bacteroidetes bacterium]|nr:T9SS type A sorting domain-containing protein [Bacteroidota bacterium]